MSERRVKEYDDSGPRELGLHQRLGEVSLRAPGEGSVREDGNSLVENSTYGVADESGTTFNKCWQLTDSMHGPAQRVLHVLHVLCQLEVYGHAAHACRQAHPA